jgi:hypothetical protein
MTEPETNTENPENREQRARAARDIARRDAIQLARGAGASIVRRPVFRGEDEPTVQDVEPLDGARAGRDLELAAKGAARDYIRQAREAGHGWERIGEALGVSPNADADQTGMTVAEAAYTYAAGSPYTDTAARYGRSFLWTCRSCDQAVSDRGLIAGPVDDEQGHADGCSRLAEAIVAWNAEVDADREAEP